MKAQAKQRLDDALKVIRTVYGIVDREILDGNGVASQAYLQMRNAGCSECQARKLVARYWFSTVSYDEGYTYNLEQGRRELASLASPLLN